MQYRYFSDVKSYLPSSIQPVLLHWYLAIMLKGCIETGIFEKIPKDEDECISIHDLCKQCRTQYDITYKSLRYMSSFGYTKEMKHGYLCHTNESLELCQDGNAYHTLQHFMDIDQNKLNFAGYLKGGTFENMNGNPLLEIMNNDHKKRQNLSGTFKEIALTSNEAELLDKDKHFDFSEYQKVIDLGGGIGELMFDIVNKYNHIEGYILEQEKHIQQAKQYWLHSWKIDIDKLDNLSFVKGDLFNQQDITRYCKDCDVIIMKRVLHDFDDEKCLKVLRNIRNAMVDEKGKILLICDLVLSDDLNNPSDLGAKFIDLEMRYLLNWKERRLSEFDSLLNQCGFNRIDGYPKCLANIHVNAYESA